MRITCANCKRTHNITGFDIDDVNIECSCGAEIVAEYWRFPARCELLVKCYIEMTEEVEE